MIDVISFLNIQFANDNKTIYIVSTAYESVLPDLRQPNRKVYLINNFLIKINYETEAVQKFRFEIRDSHRDTRVGNFALLPDSNMALLENRWLDDDNNKILICDLLSQKLIKTINADVKSILCNEDGSQMYILTNQSELQKINVPMIARELAQEPEQVVSTAMRI